MFTPDDLRELAAYQATAPMLSVYLNVDPTERTNDEYRLALRNMLRDVEGYAAAEDIAAVERYFDHEYDWAGRGVALFSHAQEDFWRAYSLAVPVSSGATVARKPYISPLAGLMDAYGSCAVALVDRRACRMLHFQMGELQASEWFEGEDIRKVKRGRGSSGGPGRRGGLPNASRHEEEVAQRNIRESAHVAERFWRAHAPQRLLIAGADPTVAQFREALPRILQEQVIGTFPADMSASDGELRERALAILQAADEEREAALVEAVFTGAAKGRGGVIRLDDTLSAAHEGRIQTLVVARDFHQPGYQCQNCAYITDHPLKTCPFCGGQFAEIPDAAEALVTKVIEDGGRVEVVDDHPKVNEFGVGALVRY